MVGLGIVLSDLNKLLRALLHKLVFFKVGDRVEEKRKHDVKPLISEMIQVLLSLYRVIEDVNTFDQNSLNFKVVDNAIRLVNECEKDEFEQVCRTGCEFVDDHDYAHDDSFDLVDRAVLLAHD